MYISQLSGKFYIFYVYPVGAKVLRIRRIFWEWISL